MHLGSVERFIWLASFIGNVALLLVLCRKRRYSEVPLFAAFVVGAVARTIVLYFLFRYGSTWAYTYAYWCLTAVVDVGLQLAVVYEVAASTFRRMGTWAPDVTRKLLWTVLAGISGAAALTAMQTTPEPTPLETLIVEGSLFTAVLMAELFAGILILSAGVGIPWRRYPGRIALGFGAYAVVVVLIEAAHDLLGHDYSRSDRTDMLLFNTRAACYVACQSYWLFSLWRDAPATSHTSAVNLVELWSSALRRKER